MAINVAQEFLRGHAGSLSESALHHQVKQMVGQVPQAELPEVVDRALRTLGPDDFTESMRQAAQQADRQQRKALVDVLLTALQQAGENRNPIEYKLGITTSHNYTPDDLVKLARYVDLHHRPQLDRVLADRLSGGEAENLLRLLGTKVDYEIGMELAGKIERQHPDQFGHSNVG